MLRQSTLPNRIHPDPLLSDPLISVETVRDALNRLLYSAQVARFCPLENLWMVDQQLLDPDHPPAQQGRAYALGVILTDLISDELTQHRLVYDLAPDAARTQREALHQIAADGSTSNIELLGWSWLYYRYVRVDLNLTLDEFSKAAHIEPRTRTRYRQHALHRLTERLIEREYEARRVLRKRRLLARLPEMSIPQVFGRERELSHMVTALMNPAVRVTQINGGMGIGKSVLAREAARTLIAADRLAHVLWIDRPKTCESIETLLQQWIPFTGHDTHLPLFDTQPALIVLDSMSSMVHELDKLEVLIARAAPLRFCLIHRDMLPLTGFSSRLNVPPLTLDDAFKMIRGLGFIDARYARSETDIAQLWNVANGIPGEMLNRIAQETDDFLTSA